MVSKRAIIEEWMVTQKRHHLSDVQVQMARELGFKPDSLRKIDNHKQEPWKTPLPHTSRTSMKSNLSVRNRKS